MTVFITGGTKESHTNKIRLYYSIAALLLIPIGLLSRRFAWINVEVGDALWAMMVFCLFRVVLAKCRLLYVVIGALVFSIADEFAQMIQSPWLVQVRSTTMGHLILGQGFAWIDLVAYSVGIGIACLVSGMAEELFGQKGFN